MSKDLPVWDLSAYYTSVKDPKLEADLAESLKRAEDFEKKYRGKITSESTAEEILSTLKEYEDLSLSSSYPIIYAYNVHAVDNSKPEHGALLQKTMKTATEVNSMLTFFTLDLNNLPAEKLKELANHEALKNYKHFLERLVEYKPHRLSEKEEIILQQKSLTSHHAFVRLFDDHKTRLQFPVKIDGKEQILNIEQTLDLMKEADRGKRKHAADVFSNVLGSDSQLTTFIMNTLVEDKSINDRLTKYETAEQFRHMDNDIDPKMVDTMVSVVSENYGVVEDYYNHKKEWMGLDELYEYDRYAPMYESKARYSFPEAKEIVLESYKKFSPEFAEKAQLFFDKSWIHAPVLKEKRGGAYCHGGSPDKHPLVLMNYQGKIEDISTLAHELGHGVNDLYMQELNPVNYDTPLVLAETASVFAEMLLFDYLKEKITDPNEKFALYADKVERIFATVFRQVSMYKFEQAVHHKYRSEGELSPESINQIWMDSQKEMFGDSVKFNEGYKYWWGYIQHFFHTPFYVYAYSFGELLVLSLYARYKAEGSAFVPKYLNLMKAGVTASPQDLLRPLGIDLMDRKFWQGGLDMIKDLVEETKGLKK